MWKSVMYITTICVVLSLTIIQQFGVYFASGNSSERFTPPSGCLCPGEDLIFECTIEDRGVTVWKGTLLNDCTVPEFSSRHQNSDFEENNIVGQCQNGKVNVRMSSRRIANSHYSQLNISKAVNSHTLNGSTVYCSHDDGTRVNNVGSWTIADPLSSPVNVHVEQANETQLHFSWDPQIPTCTSLYYVIHTTNCGICPGNTTSNFVVCDVTTDMSGVCSMVVQPMCGDMAGNIGDIFQVTLTDILFTDVELNGEHPTPSSIDNTFAIAVGITISATIIVIVGVLILIVVLVYRRRNSSSIRPFTTIKFCVSDQPKELAKVLKAIADLGISVDFIDTCEVEQQPDQEKLKWFCVSYDRSTNVSFNKVEAALEKNNIAKYVHEILSEEGEPISHIRLRFSVKDERGSLARVVKVIGDFGISIETLNGGAYHDNMREFTIEWECSNRTRQLLWESIVKNGGINLVVDEQEPLQTTVLADGEESGTIDFSIENELGSVNQVIESLARIESFQNGSCTMTFKMSTNEPGQPHNMHLVCIYPTHMRDQLQTEINAAIGDQQVTIHPANRLNTNGPRAQNA